MKVYFNSGSWSKGKGRHGLPLHGNLYFEHKGAKRCLPVIYHFPQGIVFDVITFLDESKLRTFYEKYEKIDDQLSSKQKRQVRQESPFQNICLREIRINEKVGEGFSSSSMICIPWLQDNRNICEVLKKEYTCLKDTNCFGIERFSVPYSKNDSIFRKWMRYVKPEFVKRLHLIPEPESKFYPLDHTVVLSPQQEKDFSFTHPVSGNKHTLFFQGVAPLKIPAFNRDAEKALHLYQASYEILPALPKGEKIVFDNQMDQVMGDISLGKEQREAAAIGIIGGADGPTSIFVSGKKANGMPCGKHGLPLHMCYSVPSVGVLENASFVIQGIERLESDKQEYEFDLFFT